MSESLHKKSGLLRVFVYGTLKPGEAYYNQYCAGKVVDAQFAYAFGKLFALPQGYPAMTVGDNFVYGYLLQFTNFEILKDLDQLEDYHPDRPLSENLYSRQEIAIYGDGGYSLGMAWTYLMSDRLVSQLQGIPESSGWWSGCGIKNYE